MRLRTLFLPIVSVFFLLSLTGAVPVTDNENDSSTLHSPTNDEFNNVAKRDTVISAGDAPKILTKEEIEKENNPAKYKVVHISELKKRQVGDKLEEKDKSTSLDGSKRTKREKLTVVGLGGATIGNREKRDTIFMTFGDSESHQVSKESREDASDREEETRSDRGEVEGSGDGSKPVRARRDAEEEEGLLGKEEPVESVATLQAVGRPGPDDRHRPRPDVTCAAVSCVTGTQCVIENGRPTCKPDRSEPTCETVDCRDGMRCIVDRGRPTCIPSEPQQSTCETVDCQSGMRCIIDFRGRPTCIVDENQQRTCKDVNCPRDSRCRMERDPRCRGRDCTEQPVCVRDAGTSCRNVQCPSGTRCTVQEEPGCWGHRCREVATCVNPCDSLRCPFGSSCRFDGRDAVCTPVVINPCLSARCPNGFECRNVQNQAQCFAITTTPAPTTPSPSPCFGINEEFATCATFCEPNCVEKNPACIVACAAPRCQCSNGFYRNQQGVCVPSEQCEFVPSCSPNETFVQCSTPCEPKCGQPVAIACPAICGPSKCQCKQGFWRHPASNQCVQQNQCFFG